MDDEYMSCESQNPCKTTVLKRVIVILFLFMRRHLLFYHMALWEVWKLSLGSWVLVLAFSLFGSVILSSSSTFLASVFSSGKWGLLWIPLVIYNKLIKWHIFLTAHGSSFKRYKMIVKIMSFLTVSMSPCSFIDGHLRGLPKILC